MKKVWYYNWIEKGFMDFWNYEDAVEDYKEFKESYKQIKLHGVATNEEISEHLVPAYIYYKWDEGKKFNPDPIDIVRQKEFSNIRLAKVLTDGKRLLQEVLNEKDYLKIKNWMKNSVAI